MTVHVIKKAPDLCTVTFDSKTFENMQRVFREMGAVLEERVSGRDMRLTVNDLIADVGSVINTVYAEPIAPEYGGGEFSFSIFMKDRVSGVFIQWLFNDRSKMEEPEKFLHEKYNAIAAHLKAVSHAERARLFMEMKRNFAEYIKQQQAEAKEFRGFLRKLEEGCHLSPEYLQSLKYVCHAYFENLSSLSLAGRIGPYAEEFAAFLRIKQQIHRRDRKFYKDLLKIEEELGYPRLRREVRSMTEACNVVRELGKGLCSKADVVKVGKRLWVHVVTDKPRLLTTDFFFEDVPAMVDGWIAEHGGIVLSDVLSVIEKYDF